MRRWLAVLSVVAACSPGAGTMVGIIVEVDGDLNTVTSFTVLVEGDRVRFIPSPQGDYDFPLPHLRSHLRDGSPVRVGWERQGQELVAVRLEDG